MSETPVSLVIVSYRRPKHLAVVLKSLQFQRYSNFELIVVSENRPETPLAIKWVPYDTPNIGAARNLGLAIACGEIVAFCDDDAIPEYAWLYHLSKPFADRRVGFAGGYTRGRNGVSFQWKAQLIDRMAVDHTAKANDDDDWTRFDPHADITLNTVGTNFALRRDAVIPLGGFDEAYHYYLDEADICMRLSEAGWSGAVVPQAEVHHGFAAGPHRGRNRVPRDLTEIGASTAHFLDRHCPEADRAKAMADARARQADRLRRLFDFGLIDGQRKTQLLQGFDHGAQLVRPAHMPVSKAASGDIQIVATTVSSPSTVLSAGFFGARTRAKALELAALGQSVTMVRTIPTHNNLMVRYMPEGYWLHRVGLYGRGADRGRRYLRLPKNWTRAERQRVKTTRGLSPV